MPILNDPDTGSLKRMLQPDTENESERWTLNELLSLQSAGAGSYTSERSQLNARGVIFGGQLLGQALMAAASQELADGAVAHSLRIDFLRPGRADETMHYYCQTLMSGRSITVVQVMGSQGARLVIQATVSFHRPQPGPVHQQPGPTGGPDPHTLPELADLLQQNAYRIAPSILNSTLKDLLDMRLCDGENALFEQQPEGRLRYWVRVRHTLPDDAGLHLAALAYLSDHWFSLAALGPHVANKLDNAVEVVSLNHTLWFHKAARADEWLFVDTQSPFTGSSRGLTHGSIYRRDGTLVACATQEALYRPRSQQADGLVSISAGDLNRLTD